MRRPAPPATNATFVVATTIHVEIETTEFLFAVMLECFFKDALEGVFAQRMAGERADVFVRRPCDTHGDRKARLGQIGSRLSVEGNHFPLVWPGRSADFFDLLAGGFELKLFVLGSALFHEVLVCLFGPWPPDTIDFTGVITVDL